MKIHVFFGIALLLSNNWNLSGAQDSTLVDSTFVDSTFVYSTLVYSKLVDSTHVDSTTNNQQPTTNWNPSLTSESSNLFNQFTQSFSTSVSKYSDLIGSNSPSNAVTTFSPLQTSSSNYGSMATSNSNTLYTNLFKTTIDTTGSNSPSIAATTFSPLQTSSSNYGSMATSNSNSLYTNLLSTTIVIDVVTSTIDSKAPSDQLTFRCYAFCSNSICASLNGTVDWYARLNGNEQYITSTTISYFNDRLYSFLLEAKWTSYINQEISCKIRSQLNQIDLPTVQSTWFYAGVKCVLENPSNLDTHSDDAISVSVIEGDTTGKKITCISNLPVTCVRGSISSCDLNLYLNYRNKSSFNRVVQKKCNKENNGVYQCDGCNKGFKKNPRNDISLNKVSWTLSANFESGNLNYKIEVYTIDIFSNKNSTSLRPFWAGIKMPYITFKFEPYNRPVYKSAYSFNDPHCKTFDDRYFELHEPGEFLMFENAKLSTRIHMIAKPCNPSWNPNYPYCVNKIYFQAMHEVIKIDTDQKYLLYTNLKTKKFDLPIIWGANYTATNRMDMFVISKTDWTLDVASNYGALLRIYCYTWNDVFYMWGYQVIPSKADFGQTSGLFGNWNDNRNDDIKYLKGTNTVAASDSAVYASFNALVSANNIPAFSKGKYYGYSNNAYEKSNDDDNEYDNCDCLKTNPAVTIDKCAKGQNQVSFNGKDDSNRRNKRSINLDLNELNFDSLADSPGIKTLANLDLETILGNKPTGEQSKLRNALLRTVAATNNTSCSTTFGNDPAMIKCNASGIINLNNLIDLCVADYRDDPSTDWVYGYLDSAKNKCKFTLTQDVTFMESDENGNKVLSSETITLLENLCSNNCSNQGTCREGICTCNANYSGSDCSLSTSDSPLLLGSTYTNNMFDYSSSSTSDVLLVVKKFLSDNPNGVVKVSVLSNKTSTAARSTTTVSPSTINYNLIYVNLTDISSTVASEGFYFLNLSISNNNADFSSPFTVLAYDSKSYTCGSDFTCTKIEIETTQSNKLKSGSNSLKNLSKFSLLTSFTLNILSIIRT